MHSQKRWLASSKLSPHFRVITQAQSTIFVLEVARFAEVIGASEQHNVRRSLLHCVDLVARHVADESERVRAVAKRAIVALPQSCGHPAPDSNFLQDMIARTLVEVAKANQWGARTRSHD